MAKNNIINNKKKAKKIVCMMLIVVISVCFWGILCGCQSNEEEQQGFVSGGLPSYSGPYLAYKGQYTTYPIDDVTLTFYCGSDYAGKNKMRDRYGQYPSVTYIYFADECTYTVNNGFLKPIEEFEPKNLYDKIETDENIYVCKKLLSTDPDSFYKCNGVTRLYKDLSFYNSSMDTYPALDAWGGGSPLYNAGYHLGNGVVIPDVSYTFTIPSKFFDEEKGSIYFCMASYISEDDDFIVKTYEQGELLEEETLTISYQCHGDYVTLFGQTFRR